MERRRFIVFAAVCFGYARRVAAQVAGRPARIAYLTGYSVDVDKPLLAAFKQGLNELGYTEGRNIVIEARHASGQPARMETLAAELAASKPDIFVVAAGAAAALAARNVAGRIPIVMANVQDPVASGLVTSLARPGGNITGMSDFHAASVTKRLELMNEAVPALRIVGVLWNQDSATNARQLTDLERAASAIGVKILSLPIRKPDDIEGAVRRLRGERGAALLLLGDFVLTTNMRQIARQALEYRIPAAYTLRGFVDEGGFMSYGTSFEDLYRRSARFVDKILRGAKPGDLPIEQPTKFDLLINLKTAKTIGVSVPRALLMRADRVIE
jgi:putative tryptophan/tyrosine transport system substrate-binding protein